MLKKLFGNLFPSREQTHSKPESKPALSASSPQAEHDQTPEARQQLIEALLEAKTDADRQNHLQQVSQIKTLQELAGRNPDTALQALLEKRWGQLVAEAINKDPQADIPSCYEQAPEFIKAEALIALKDLALTEKLAGALNDEMALARLVSRHKNGAFRNSLKTRIHQADALEFLSKNSNDKSIRQEAKTALKQQQQAARETQALQQEAQELCEKLEQLIGKASDKHFSVRFNQLKQHWQAISPRLNHDAALQERFETSARLAEDLLAQQEAAEQEARQAAEAIQELEDTCKLLEQTLNQIRNSAEAINRSTLKALMETQKNRWHAASETVRAPLVLQDRFAGLMTQLEKLLQSLNTALEFESELATLQQEVDNNPEAEAIRQLRKRLSEINQAIQWPAEIPLPESLQLLATIDQSLTLADQAHQESYQKELKNLHKLKRFLVAEKRKGNLKQASRLYNQIESSLDTLSPRDRQWWNNQLLVLKSELEELQDWHTFATEPKKQALCEAMEALIEKDMPPQQKARRIKQLQQDWKTHSTTRLGEQADPLWERFHAAAEKAFEPCKAYFAEQDAIKADNHNKRLALCEELESWLASQDWEAEVDWQQVQQILNTARDQWRHCSPVSPEDHESLKPRFDALLERIKAPLHEEKTRNQKRLETLVQQVARTQEQLQTGALSIQEAIQQAKQAQQEWKTVGITYPKENRRLWESFRQACDAIFDYRRQQAQTAQQQVKQAESAAWEMIQAVEKLLSQSDAGKIQQSLKTLIDQFNQLENLPRQQQGKLEKSFNKAVRQVRSYLSELPLRQEQEALAAMQPYLDFCQRQEQQLLDQPPQASGQEDLFNTPALEDLAKDWSTLSEVAPVPALETRFATLQECLKAPESLPDIQAEHLKQLEAIAIELEVLTERETPEPWKPQRMAWQLEQLEQKKNLPEGDALTRRKLALHRQWLTLGFVDASSRKPLDERIRACLEQDTTPA